MTDVTYTRYYSPVSEVVDDIYYNDRDQTLVVDLNDRVYRYSNVPAAFFEESALVKSVGREWLPRLKRTYGPSQFLGWYDDLEWDDIEESSRVEATLGTPNDFTYAPDAVVDGAPVSAGQPVGVAGNTGASAGPHVSFGEPAHLSLVSEAPAYALYGVTFEVDGKRNEHSLRALDEAEAVAEVEKIAEMLDLTFKIVAVTHYFE